MKMVSHRFATAAVAARRAIPTLGLAAALALATLGPPVPAGVAAAPAEPLARLQLVVKQVTIHDDREGRLSGKGEMSLYAGIWRCKEGISPPCNGGASVEGMPWSIESTAGPIVRAARLLDASTGDTVTLEREVPQLGDLMWGGDTSPELGFAVSAGQRYVVQFDMEEFDTGGSSIGGSNFDDYMGRVHHFIDTGEHGLGIGTHTARSVRDDGVSPGDYTVTYEIRRAPVPDIEPVGITIYDLPGSAEKRVCMAVLNREVAGDGPFHAGPFEVALRVDGVVPPDGKYTVGVLGAGAHFSACVETALPTSGQHTLAAVADAPRALAEFNEANNVYEQPYQGTPPAPAPKPSPSAALPALTVGAIEINGRVPDGKDDCEDGKNDVAVVVKNGGTANAASFAVALSDDVGGTWEKSVSGLGAGKEREVRFDNVGLKKGERTLSATVDSREVVAESDEGNNTLKVTASCKDD